MTKLALSLATAGLLCFFHACTPSLAKVNLAGIPKKIEMDKGPCPGNCPIYKLTLYDNSIVVYEGERNTDRTGLYYKRLDKTKYQQLLANFRETNLWQFNDVYRGGLMDQQTQTVSITFHDQGSSKKVLGKSNRPEQVLALERQLDMITREDDWVARNAEQQATTSNMIVQLRPGIDAKSWAKKYRDSKLEVVENFGSREDFWLVKFDAQRSSGDQLLRKIRRDEEVVGVEMRR